MTQQEAIALVKELRRYSARLDDLAEQAAEAVDRPDTRALMAWMGGVVESMLDSAHHNIGHAIAAIEAAHDLADDDPKELVN